VLIWKRFSPIVAQSWKSWRGRVLTSEAHYFSEFRRACLINNESHITRTFWVWIDCRYSGTQTSTLKMAGIRNYDANMFNYFRKLEKQHYGEQKEEKTLIDSREFYRRVKQLRKFTKTRPLRNPKPVFVCLNPGRD
jgi:hypothetical protein